MLKLSPIANERDEQQRGNMVTYSLVMVDTVCRNALLTQEIDGATMFGQSHLLTRSVGHSIKTLLEHKNLF